MFEHEIFEVYEFEKIPLGRDCFLMDQKYMKEWEECLAVRNGHESEKIGFVGFVAARQVSGDVVELSWYLNIFSRYHPITIQLPRSKFVACAGATNCDEKVHIFVDSEWFDSLTKRLYAVFGMVDAIDMKDALKSGAISRKALEELRNGIDGIASAFPDVAFVSFADSILLKGHWSTEYVIKGAPQTYQPEQFLEIYRRCRNLFKSTLGLNAYGIFTQGANEFYEDALLHISNSKNHIGLNSFGTPFAQLMDIDIAARMAIRKELHSPADLYLEQYFFATLNFKSHSGKEGIPSSTYESKILGTTKDYYYCNHGTLIKALDLPKSLAANQWLDRPAAQ